MSAYSFGKIVTADSNRVTENVVRLGSESGIEVRFGLHEPDDREVLDETALLKGEGVVFNLFTPGASDIVALCNEATEAGRAAIRGLLGEARLPYSWEQARTLALPDQVYAAVLRTRLGRFVEGLFQIDSAKGAGLAIFNNGVEQVIEETAANCKFLILRSLLVAWDIGPSALFVWKGEAHSLSPKMPQGGCSATSVPKVAENLPKSRVFLGQQRAEDICRE